MWISRNPLRLISRVCSFRLRGQRKSSHVYYLKPIPARLSETATFTFAGNASIASFCCFLQITGFFHGNELISILFFSINGGALQSFRILGRGKVLLYLFRQTAADFKPSMPEIAPDGMYILQLCSLAASVSILRSSLSLESSGA